MIRCPVLSEETCMHYETTGECSSECRRVLRRMLNKSLIWQCVLAIRAMRLAEDIRNGTHKYNRFGIEYKELINWGDEW